MSLHTVYLNRLYIFVCANKTVRNDTFIFIFGCSLIFMIATTMVM
jgi:hypothetical protein